MKALGSVAVLVALGGAAAGAQAVPFNVTPVPPPQSVVHGTFGGGFHHRFRGGGFVIVEDEPEVVHDVVVVHDKAAEQPPPAPPPPPRKPYVIGRTYSALPGGCMKLLEHGASFYQCSGEWYRRTGSGAYLAVREP